MHEQQWCTLSCIAQLNVTQLKESMYFLHLMPLSVCFANVKFFLQTQNYLHEKYYLILYYINIEIYNCIWFLPFVLSSKIAVPNLTHFIAFLRLLN